VHSAFEGDRLGFVRLAVDRNWWQFDRAANQSAGRWNEVRDRLRCYGNEQVPEITSVAGVAEEWAEIICGRDGQTFI
jgi:hypothetical protein